MENNSPTDTSVEAVASQEPTTVATTEDNSAEVVNQETNPVDNSAVSVSDGTANTQGTEEKQTESTGDSSQTDEGLASFARGQGYSDEDIEQMSEREKKTLLSLKKNVDKFRNRDTSELAKAKASVDGDVTRDELEAFQSEFRQYQAQKQAENFFSQEGRDKTLEPVMSEILQDKKAEHGPEYARVLAADLELLYDLARIKTGAGDNAVDTQQVRQEERESINRKLSAGVTTQHASSSDMSGAVTVNEEWFRTTYDPYNPEHAKMRDAYFAQN